SDLRLRQLREQIADIGEESSVGRRVRARSAADRRLVDVDHLVDQIQSIDPRVGKRRRMATIEMLREQWIECLVDERRFARAGESCDADECAERDAKIDVLQVVPGRTTQYDLVAVSFSPLLRHFDLSLLAQILE